MSPPAGPYGVHRTLCAMPIDPRALALYMTRDGAQPLGWLTDEGELIDAIGRPLPISTLSEFPEVWADVPCVLKTRSGVIVRQRDPQGTISAQAVAGAARKVSLTAIVDRSAGVVRFQPRGTDVTVNVSPDVRMDRPGWTPPGGGLGAAAVAAVTAQRASRDKA